MCNWLFNVCLDGTLNFTLFIRLKIVILHIGFQTVFIYAFLSVVLASVARVFLMEYSNPKGVLKVRKKFRRVKIYSQESTAT
jgi:hypothetical protein